MARKLRRASGSARRHPLQMAAAAAVACAVAAVLIANAIAGAGVPAPSLAVRPPNPSSSSSASFTFTDSQPVTFKCRLDSQPLTTCGTNSKTGSASYSSLADGSHTFSVYALAGSAQSATTSYAWTVDTAPPRVVSITRDGASPTSAPSVSWTVTFSEAVKGLDAHDFQLVVSELSGGPKLGPITPGAATLSPTFEVSATTGTGVGSLNVNVLDDDSVKDAAGNPLGGTGKNNGNFTGRAGSLYAVDHVKPEAPTLTTYPPSPSSSPVTFAWTENSADVVAYYCSLDSGPFGLCTSPWTLSLANGDHEFKVYAADAAGNQSGRTAFRWKVKVAAGQPYTISASIPASLYPGGTVLPIDLIFTSTNSGNGGTGVNGTQVSNLTVKIDSVTGGLGSCSVSDYQVTQFSGSYPFYIPSGTSDFDGSNSSQSLGYTDKAQWPHIRMIDTGANQDGCRGATVNLSLAGTP